ncbi:MAG: hypothetical protein AB1898_04625 [Acidobacteriota bacterium]
MIKTRLSTIVILAVLCVRPLGLLSVVTDENKVILGPGYQEGQKSRQVLSFVPPADWMKDEQAAKKLGLHAVIVPDGKSIENADRVVTIAFQKKDLSKQGLANLKNFARLDIQNTMTQFPDCQAARWQPSGLDPVKMNFFSIELYGREKDKPSPHHLLILEATDGYFSITLTAATVEELRRPAYEDFFNSISLK